MKNLSFVRGCLIDLDGTVYRGRMPIPGAIEAVQRLEAAGIKVGYLSNNASVSRAGVARRLIQLGLELELPQVVTGTSLAASYVKDHFADRMALLIGEEGLAEELQLANITFGRAGESDFNALDYGAVVVGCDRHFSYVKLNQALQVLLLGGGLIATDGDATYPTEEGVMPGTGAVLAGIERAAGREAIVAGKPSRYAAQKACEALRLSLDECLVIGDRLDSDIALGQHIGGSALVYTGVTEPGFDADIYKPSFAKDDLAEVVEVILKAGA